MTDHYDFSELNEMIKLGFREQAMHPQGLNSSHTHSTLYPASEPRNKQPQIQEESPKAAASGSSKPLHTRAGSR